MVMTEIECKPMAQGFRFKSKPLAVILSWSWEFHCPDNTIMVTYSRSFYLTTRFLPMGDGCKANNSHITTVSYQN